MDELTTRESWLVELVIDELTVILSIWDVFCRIELFSVALTGLLRITVERKEREFDTIDLSTLEFTIRLSIMVALTSEEFAEIFNLRVALNKRVLFTVAFMVSELMNTPALLSRE